MDFTTADLCDEHPQLISVLDPLFRNYGGTERFSGPVETVQVYEDNAIVRETLETQGKGRVLVVDGGGSLRCALIGGRLGQLAQRNGWSGLLINGCVRDTVELARITIGVRALNAVPMRSAKERKGSIGTVVSFAGVSFTPGKVLYADADGL
ncbi:MAG TPA: ribonuclease E activity regulator RraA, partial [Gemmatimonadales bacterium]|nr:ribonuclease E activity regulator RraA [Gemmatimonadales bacterium]